jgi:hypothetical protein
MILKYPFFIGSALVPAIKIGDATLSLLETRTGHRDTAVFELQTPTFTYVDDRVQSGFQGFVSTVEVFETFLGFLDAAVESFEYEQHTGCEGENATLFPPHVLEWAVANKSDLQTAVSEITDDSGEANHNLIED